MKRMYLIALVLGVGLLMGCQPNAKENTHTNAPENEEKTTSETTPELTALWATPQELDVPESVCYDADNQVLYVANIVGKPSEKDGQGFISRLSLQGKIIDREWVTGLDAPKGMGIVGDKLYVTNIDEVVEIAISEGQITNRYPLAGAQFANDIATHTNGSVFISDMATNKIYRLKEGQASVFLTDSAFQSTNGLYVTPEALYIGTKGQVFHYNLETDALRAHIGNTGSIDGLEAVDDDHFLISDWSGHVHLIHPEKEKVLLLDTTPEEVNAADIAYIPEKKLLFVPTFFDNRVTAYKLNL